MNDPVSQLADEIEREIETAFLDAIEDIRTNIDLPSLVAAAERDDDEAVLGYVGARLRPLEVILDRAFIRAGTIAADRLSLSFDPADAVALAARAAAVAGIMKRVITDTVAAMLQAALKSTLLPAAIAGSVLIATLSVQGAEKAILVREAIGLSPAQGASLVAFRAVLERALAQQQPELPARPGLRREQPDPADLPGHYLRHLSAPQQSAIEKATRLPLDRERIETLVARQRRTFLQIRASAIGTAGSITITNAGENASWQQAVQHRDLGPDWRRFWRDVGDERVRHIHREVKILNPDGVGIDEPFETALGPCFHPPLEAGCRCRVELRQVVS